MNPFFYPIKLYGERLAWPRRRRVIADALVPFLSPDQTLLDVGCGDGRLAAELAQRIPSLSIHGADSRLPSGGALAGACVLFDGNHLPFPDGAYDNCLLIDVLHHSRRPVRLLKETARVARSAVIVKDHDYGSRLDFRLMQIGDYLGNRMYGIDLPYHFSRWEEFEAMFREAGLSIRRHEDGLKPAGRMELHHHFIVKLVPTSP